MEHAQSRNSTLLDSKYWEFFVPTILMAMTTTMSVVVDSIIVGNMLGASALAAVNLAMPVMMAYTTISVMIGLGGATLISIAKGKRQDDYANRIFTLLVLTMAAVGVVMLVGQRAFLDPISDLLTSEPTLRPLAESYLHALLYGTPLIIVTFGMTYCLRVDGRVKLASSILVASNLINLGLDVLYMGPLKLGIAGSALATVSGYVIGAAMLFIYFLGKERTLRFDFGVLSAPAQSLADLRALLATGAPASMGVMLMTFKILIINAIVLDVAGKSGMVAFSVCLSCLSLVSMFISGAAQAMTPIVGVLFGEGDYNGIRFVFRRACTVLLAASVLSLLVLESVPEWVLALFGVTHQADIALGVPAIRIFALSLVGTSMTYLFMFYYLTVGQRTLSTAISTVQGFVVVVPAAWVLSRFLGEEGIWIAFSLGEAVTMTMVYVLVRRMRRKAPERFRSALLLDHALLPPAETLETTLADVQATDATEGSVNDFLREQGVVQAEVIAHAAADTVRCILRDGYGAAKAPAVDLRVAVAEDAVTIALRDAAKGFDAGKACTSRSGESVHAPDVTFSRAIGFNNTTLTFARQAE